MRLIPILMAALLAACNDPMEPQKTGTPDRAGRNATDDPNRTAEPVSPPTGISNAERMHDDYRALYAELAKQETPDQAHVKQLIKGCDTLIKVLERSVKEGTLQSLKSKHARMNTELGSYNRQELVFVKEREEIRAILADAAKGIQSIPAGFTEAELKDKMGDLEEELRKIQKEKQDLLAEMVEIEKLLAKPADEIPPATDTKAARELEAVLALRKKAEALLN